MTDEPCRPASAESGEQDASGTAAPEPTYSRRRFVGLLGSSVPATAAMSTAGRGSEPPAVSMGNNYFDPVGLFVEPGTTVRFEIVDGSHSATAYSDRIPADADSFDSGVISEGGFEHTFTEPGTYDYYCSPHQSMGMVGRVVVGEPGGPAESGSIPAGSVPDSDDIVEQGAITTEEAGGSGGHGRGMMGGGMGDHDGWMLLAPLGFLTAVVGLVTVVAYLATCGEERDADSAVETLRDRYERGELTEAEFERRRDRLKEP